MFYFKLNCLNLALRCILRGNYYAAAKYMQQYQGA